MENVKRHTKISFDNTYDELINEGIEQGIEQGREEGRQEGRQEVIEQLIKNLPNWSDLEIAEIVGISIDVVRKIRKK